MPVPQEQAYFVLRVLLPHPRCTQHRLVHGDVMRRIPRELLLTTHDLRQIDKLRRIAVFRHVELKRLRALRVFIAKGALRGAFLLPEISTPTP